MDFKRLQVPTEYKYIFGSSDIKKKKKSQVAIQERSYKLLLTAAECSLAAVANP